MITHVRTALLKSFVWRGRAARPEFWWAWLAKLIVDGVAAALPGVLGLIGAGLSFALLPMVVSAAVRRLHDRGRSALALLAFFASAALVAGALVLTTAESPLGGPDAPPPLGVPSLLEALAFAWLVFALWLVVVLARAGDPAPNRYGPPPGAPSAP